MPFIDRPGCHLVKTGKIADPRLNSYRKKKASENLVAYKNTETIVADSLKRKYNFYNNLDTRLLTDNKTFWKTIKPLLTEKKNNMTKILRSIYSAIFDADSSYCSLAHSFLQGWNHPFSERLPPFLGTTLFLKQI